MLCHFMSWWLQRRRLWWWVVLDDVVASHMKYPISLVLVLTVVRCYYRMRLPTVVKLSPV